MSSIQQKLSTAMIAGALVPLSITGIFVNYALKALPDQESLTGHTESQNRVYVEAREARSAHPATTGTLFCDSVCCRCRRSLVSRAPADPRHAERW